MKTSKINNVRIKPIITHSHPIEKIAGYKLFPEPYCNVAIIAKKKSGKTSVAYNCLEKCVGKNTHVWIFSSTIHRDSTYKEMLNMLEKKKCAVDTFTHFQDENGNYLAEIIAELKSSGDDDDEPEHTQTDKNGVYDRIGSTQQCKPKFGDANEQKENEILEKKKQKEYEILEKRERKKKLYPEHIFLFDDLGSDLRNKSISQLLKTNRHFKAKVFLLGHTLTDLEPGSRKQLDYALIFKSFSEDKLKDLYKDLDLSLDFEKFLDAYNYATEKPFNFLYVSTKTDELRKNFNEKIDF
jgi:hypothetical protein